MIKYILKQIWNKRRSNTWIVLELVLVTCFMWIVIDPVYVLLSNRAIDEGYNTDNVFAFSVGEYAGSHGKYKEEYSSDSIRKVNFLCIYDRVREFPDIESVVIVHNQSHPYAGSYNGNRFKADSVFEHGQMLSFYKDGEYFKVFDMKGTKSGTDFEVFDHRTLTVPGIYLTGGLARKFFPEGDAYGKKLTNGLETQEFHIAGIIPHFKYRTIDQPKETYFIVDEEPGIKYLPWSAKICFRIREGISKQIFAEQFKKNMTPQVRLGNFYFQNLTLFDNIRKEYEYRFGVTNSIRLQLSLAAFFLICTFLGIAGTFWLRGNTRRSELGLRIALGSYNKRIICEFILEGCIITTISWLIGVFLIMQYIYYVGFSYPTENGSTEFIQNHPIWHFLIVSTIVYILMIFIAVIGTWIPAWRASAIEPSDALRDE